MWRCEEPSSGGTLCYMQWRFQRREGGVLRCSTLSNSESSRVRMMGANSTDWHALPVGEVAQLLQTRLDRGLKQANVFQLQKKFGPNELKGQREVNPWTVLLGQFSVILLLTAMVAYSDWLAVILVLAAMVAYAVQDFAEAAAVASVIDNVECGPNELEGQRGVNPWTVLLGQFTNGLTVILILAAIVSYAVQDYAEAAVLAFVIIYNAIVGFVQEYLAEVLIDATRRVASPTAKVIRDGAVDRISSPLVVPGDVLVFEEGDVVPADCRLIEVLNLEVDEAMLTGELLPVAKGVQPIKGDSASLRTRLNMVYSGTTLIKGSGRGIAIATGLNTEIGKMTKSIIRAASDSAPMQPLNQRSYILFAISLLLAVVVFAVNKFNFSAGIILLAVSLAIAVAAVNE